jgi:hypothetical protein
MSNAAKKPRLEHLFHYRNMQCSKRFTSEQGLHIPCGMSSQRAAQPWDIDDKDTNIACVANTSVAAHNNSVLKETGINRIKSDQKANQFGIRYTTEQFAETKLLKILNNTAAPHLLYQDILAWASEAKRIKYSFCPQRLGPSSPGTLLSRNCQACFTRSSDANNSNEKVKLYQPIAHITD